MVTALAAADLDGDGEGEVVVGGRGLGVVGSESLNTGRYRWVHKWQDAEGEPLSSDRESVTELVVEDLTDDGLPDMVVGSDKALFAVDGRDGRTLWTAVDDSSGTANGADEVAVADFDRDGVPDAAFAELLDERVSAVDGRDGSPMWSYPRPLGFVSDLAAGDLNGDGYSDVVVVGQVDAGLEIHAISGFDTEGDGSATPLWVQRFPVLPGPDAARPGSIAIDQVEPGLAPEVIVGGYGALVVLDGLTGLTRTRRTFERKAVADVRTVQLDADPALEMAATSVEFSSGGAVHQVEAFDSDTESLWAYRTPGPVGEFALTDLDGAGPLDIVVGGGWQTFGGHSERDGYVLALRSPPVPGGAPQLMWGVDAPSDVDSIAVGEVMGQQTVLAGQLGALGGGGGLYALDMTGKSRWFFRTGGRVADVEVADLDGDLAAEVIEGAEDSRVAVHSRAGDLVWQTRVPGKGGPAVSAVTAGELTADAGLEIAAGTVEYDADGPDGRVHLYSGSGERLWSRDIAGSVDAVEIADIDRDGAAEVLVAASAQGVSAVTGVAARLDAAGDVVWERPAPTGQRTSLSLLDLNEDGTEDLVLTRASVYHGGAVLAIDGATGEDLWQLERPESVNWASVTTDPADGVTAGDLSGVVNRLAAITGEPVWTADPGSASWGGGWSADVDGDDIPDVLSASHEGMVRMLSGATGQVLWAADTAGNPGHKVATLRGGAYPLVGVGELGQGTYAEAHILLLDARTGTRLGVTPTHGPVLDLSAGNLDDDPVEELVAAAGWQVTAIDAAGMPIGPQPTSLSFTEASAAKGQYSDRTLYGARLRDTDGQPITSAEVTFTLAADDSPPLVFTDVTDADGLASVSPLLTAVPGLYALTVEYAGDDQHQASHRTTPFILEKEDSAIELSTTGHGNTNTLLARLSDLDTPGHGVAGRTVQFYSESTPIGSAQTGDDGIAKLAVPPGHRGSKHTYTAAFPGDDHYLAAFARTESNGPSVP